MPSRVPLAVVIAGPNGAGKSTMAPRLLQEALAVSEFVNADAIAMGLSAFRPASVTIGAGRIMLARLRETWRRATTIGAASRGNWSRHRIEIDALTEDFFLDSPPPPSIG
jgi:predicted ABC-type ATPase